MERRIFPRYSMKYKVSFRISGDELKSCKAYTENVSHRGLKLNLNEDIAAGEILDLKIHTAILREPVCAKAKVIWSVSKENSKSFDAGLEFIQIGWNESEKLLSTPIKYT